MVNTIFQSYSEVYDIIEHMDKKLYNKIPGQFIEMIKKDMDINYKVDIDYNKNINDQKLLKDTRVILSIIYRDYICSKEKREELIEKEKLDLIKYENELKEEYNPDNIFKNRIQEKNIERSKEQENITAMVEYKENIFSKLIEFIKNVFYKNN